MEACRVAARVGTRGRMKTFNIRKCIVVVIALWMSIGITQNPAWADEPTAKPTSQPSEAATKAMVETVQNYYAELYSKPFKTETNARLSHLVAIVSLSHIDGPALTKRLLVPVDLQSRIRSLRRWRGKRCERGPLR